MKFYTGIGSRETPERMTDVMSDLAVILYGKGYTLRSGRAEGADYAFQRGAEFKLNEKAMISSTRAQQEIYLPKPGFNTQFGRIGAIDTWMLLNYEEAEDIIETIHPKGRHLRGFARQAHTRNVYQVLGLDLNTPSEFLVCWAEVDHKGNALGGTATAWKLAKQYKIPCYNLNVEGDFLRLVSYLGIVEEIDL